MKLFRLYRKNSSDPYGEGCQLTDGSGFVVFSKSLWFYYRNDRALQAVLNGRYHEEPVLLSPENEWKSSFRCGFMHSAENADRSTSEFVSFSNGLTTIFSQGLMTQVLDRHYAPTNAAPLPHDKGSGHYLDRFFDQCKWYRSLTCRSWFLVQPKGFEAFWVDRDHIAMHPILEIEYR